jgi:hypothetical protein
LRVAAESHILISFELTRTFIQNRRKHGSQSRY